MTDSNKWTVRVEEDPTTGELILPFPSELMDSLGWIEGDVIQWHDNLDGSFTLNKKT